MKKRPLAPPSATLSLHQPVTGTVMQPRRSPATVHQRSISLPLPRGGWNSWNDWQKAAVVVAGSAAVLLAIGGIAAVVSDG